MVDAGGQDEHVARHTLQPQPAVVAVAHVEVAAARRDEADLLVLVDVLLEERRQLERTRESRHATSATREVNDT